MAIRRQGTVAVKPNTKALNLSRSTSHTDRHSMGVVQSPTLAQSDKDIKREEKLQKKRQKFLNTVLQNLQDVEDENSKIYQDIANMAGEHINNGEHILTFSESDLLQSFLIAAHKGVDDEMDLDDEDQSQGSVSRGENATDFHVYVCETAPSFKGHKTAARLLKAGLNVALASDSSVFALMSKISKVIISTHGIMANGGLIAESGAY